MNRPEQLTLQEIHDGAFTLADLAIYGGLVAVGALIGLWLLLKQLNNKGD